jgi:hypothetical protein
LTFRFWSILASFYKQYSMKDFTILLWYICTLSFQPWLPQYISPYMEIRRWRILI